MTPTLEVPVAQDPGPSLADIKAWAAEKPATDAVVVVPAEEPKPITPEAQAEPSQEAAPAKAEAESGPAKTDQEPETVEEEKEPELPPNVIKRIARETVKQAGIQREIDKAVSARKAKESELAAALASTGKSGSEPAPTTVPAKASDKPVKPVMPVLKDYEGEPDPYAALDAATSQYNADLSVWQDAHDTWLIAETRKTVEQQMTERQRRDEAKSIRDEAVEKHGPEFNDLMETVMSVAPEGLQMAFNGLDDWSGTAVYLAKHPDELKALAAQYATNPYAAVAALGKLEVRLEKETEHTSPPAPKAAHKKETPLPNPPARVGGAPSASTDVDLQTADMRTFKRTVESIVGR